MNKQTRKKERREKKERTRELESRVTSHTGFYICQSSISFPPAMINILNVCLPFINYVPSVVDMETVLTCKGSKRQFILEPQSE